MSKSLSISELVTLVNGQLVSDPTSKRLIYGIATLGEAAPQDASFFGNAKYLADFRATKAGAVLVPASHVAQLKADGAPHDCCWIQVENPTLAFSQLIDFFAAPEPQFAPGIHPTAILGKDVQIGKNVSIQPYVVIEDGVKIDDHTIIGAFAFIGQKSVIGQNCFFHPHVTIREGSQIGDRVIFHSGVVIGSDGYGFEHQNGQHVKLPQKGIVQVGDDVEIGANTTVDRARFGKTRIGNGTKIDNLVQVAHNVTIGSHCLLVAQVGIGGSSSLGDYVTLAGQVGVVGHVHIGDKSIVTAQTGVSKDLPNESVVFGSPCEPLQKAKEMLAYTRRLPKLAEQVKRLSKELAEITNLNKDS